MPYKVTGLKQFKHAIDPAGLDRTMREELRRAAAINGQLGAAHLRKTITDGGFQRNAALTVAIKGGSKKPLVDTAALFQAITSVPVDEYSAFAGVLRTSAAFSVAEAITEGATIQVTPRMRGMFFALYLASQGSDSVTLEGRAAELFARQPHGWKPLSAGTAVIVIPARDWVAKAFRSRNLKRMVTENWLKALGKTMKKRAKGSS